MRPASVALRLLPTLVVLVIVGAALQWADWPRFDACYHVEYDIYVPDPELGYGFRPGANVGGVVVNALGLRGPVLSPDKPEGTLRVLTVGDSTAFGLGVGDQEAFAALAPHLLAEDLPGRPIEYAIAALPGYSSYQSRVLLRRMLPLHPDLVAFYVGARNDLTKGSYYPDSAIPARMRRRQEAWHHVKLLRAGENLVDFFHKEVIVKLRAKRNRARVPLDEFRANVRAMLSAAHEAGAACIVLVPPWSRSLLRSFPFLEDYRSAVGELGREAGATVVPLQPLFTGLPEEAVYLPDRLHFNPRGHRIAAEAIRDAVLRDGLLPGAAPPRAGRTLRPDGAAPRTAGDAAPMYARRMSRSLALGPPLAALALALAVGPALAGCGRCSEVSERIEQELKPAPVPAERADYLGVWQGEGVTLEIRGDGMVRYQREKGGSVRSIEAPLQRFVGPSFVVGVGPLATTFDVSEPPHRDGDEWKMTVDGTELVRVEKGLPIPEPGGGTPI